MSFRFNISEIAVKYRFPLGFLTNIIPHGGNSLYIKPHTLYYIYIAFIRATKKKCQTYFFCTHTPHTALKKTKTNKKKRQIDTFQYACFRQ